jgi:cation:H+ antiporter
MIAVGALLLLLIPDGMIGRGEGFLLFGLLLVYLIALYRHRRTDLPGQNHNENGERIAGRIIRSLVEVTVGIAVLVIGARWLVNGAIEIAVEFGIPERLIGMTMVAFGTSLPELASCVVAALKKEGDLLLGNLVGSSVFNVLAILGLTAIVRPIAVIPGPLRIDIIIMTGFGLLTLALLAKGGKITRWEGGVLLLSFAAYSIWIFARM